MNTLIGKNVDRTCLPIEWDEEETADGIEIYGVIRANRNLGY